MLSLHEWYRRINGTYLDRNFYRSTESIFAHLVEVCGGLSASATTRRKRNLNREEFLPKAIAWWLALCGRAGIPSIEDMLWAKFPRVCPYCRLDLHSGKQCKESKPERGQIDWAELAKIARDRIKDRPKRLAEWQVMFNDVYPRDDSTTNENNVYRLTEELGELAEATRALPVAPEYFVSEAPDVFAWLMGFANQFDFDRHDQSEYGASLSESMQRYYPGHCVLCGMTVCKCPPIPASTLGRIAREAPLAVLGGERLFSLGESIALFRKAEQSIVIGDRQVTTHAAELEKIQEDTAKILAALERNEGWKTALTVQLTSSVTTIQSLAKRGELTQAAVDEILQTLKSLPTEQRQQALGFLTNLAASATFAALLAAAKALGG